MSIFPKNKENCAYLTRLESDIKKALDNSGVSLDILWLVIEDFSDTYEASHSRRSLYAIGIRAFSH